MIPSPRHHHTPTGPLEDRLGASLPPLAHRSTLSTKCGASLSTALRLSAVSEAQDTLKRCEDKHWPRLNIHHNAQNAASAPLAAPRSQHPSTVPIHTLRLDPSILSADERKVRGPTERTADARTHRPTTHRQNPVPGLREAVEHDSTADRPRRDRRRRALRRGAPVARNLARGQRDSRLIRGKSALRRQSIRFLDWQVT